MSLRPVARVLLAAASLTLPAIAAAPAGAAAVPTITKLDPNVVFSVGNDLVFIHGTDLATVTGVTVDGAPVDFSDEGDGTLSFFTPSHSIGKVEVRVTSPAGTSVDNGTADDLIYGGQCARPEVTSVAPSTGPISGGTSVVIRGTNLEGTRGVVFGDSSVGTSLQVISNGELRVTTPPVAQPGVQSVLILNDCGGSFPSAASQFTYTAPALPRPVIDRITPAYGIAGIGGLVSIFGHDFGTVTAVTFGSTPATRFFYNKTQVIAFAPPLPKGSVVVKVTSAGGTTASSSKTVYKYLGR